MDEALVRALLRDQHPDLAGLSLRPVAGGWDNQLWRLGEDLAVRLPRTDRAPALLRKEHRWLPTLAPRLPLPVPEPIRVGEPSHRFPHPWAINTWVPGLPADRAELGPWAETLADFLQALHQPAPADAPANPNGQELLSEPRNLPDRLRDVWTDAVTAPPWDGPPVWLHGDLHPANVVTTDGALTGVIDWGCLCAGDPATDLAAAWALLPDAERFFQCYPTDAATIRRARGRAIGVALFLMDVGEAWRQGRPGGQPGWDEKGRQALDRLARPAAWLDGVRPG